MKTVKQAVSVLLTMAMLLGLLPAGVASAAGQLLPQDTDYKGFSMEDLNNHAWVSYDKYSERQTMFFVPVDLSGGNTWTKLTFTIELSQYVSLELYKLKGGYIGENLAPHLDERGNIDYYTLPLASQGLPEPDPEDPDRPVTREDLLEDFLDERMGYLRGVSVTEHISSTEDGVTDITEAKTIDAADLSGDWGRILKSATRPGAAKVTADHLYAFGFTGLKFVEPEPEPEESTAPAAAYTVEEGIALFSSMDDAKVQNYFIWDGSVEKDGTVTNQLEDGYYVIVMTPEWPEFMQFNSFLAFESKGMDVGAFNVGNYHEPEMTAEEYARSVDPVDVSTGSFVWDYTDFSLYGKHDLPFTRYYSSIDGNRNYGLGRGWTTEYTADLRLETFFAQATLPGSRKLNFNLNFDGSYQADGDYTLAWNGGGYTLTNTYTKDIYRFDADGKVLQLVHPDGNIISCSYTGDRLTAISNSSGSFTLAYNAQGDVSSVTDSEGRSITLTYDGHYLTSVENPDGDSLAYTYDANGYLATVKNFKGQVYVQNTYNADGQVTHQYATGIGTFDFTYDRASRHNTCTGTGGYQLEIRYDEKGRITESTNAAGTVYFTWNDNNQLTSQTDRNGKTASYDHDAAGNVSKITYPDGTTERMTYNAARKVTGFTDRRGNTQSYTYNANGNVLTATDGRGTPPPTAIPTATSPP